MALLYLRWKRPNADRPYKVLACIDFMHKWQPIYYSFQFLLISPHFRVKMLMNFTRANKAGKANFHDNKIII